VDPPPPPPPPPPPEQPKLDPPKLARVKVARPEKPPPVEEAPPPDEPPPAAPPKQPPLVVGISMSSTTTAGSFAAPVGNTRYGKIGEKAQDASQVQPRPRYVPVYQVDRVPQFAIEVKIPYPDEAKRAGIYGQVVMSVRIGASGDVLSVKVLSGPGYGLDEAAADAVRRSKWRPAMKNGEPVETEIKYAYTFELN